MPSTQRAANHVRRRRRRGSLDGDFTSDDLAALLKTVGIQRQTRSTTAHLVRQEGYDTENRFRRLVLGATLLLCLLPAFASAQPVTDPPQIEFSPSPDHATASSYLLEVAVAGQVPVVKAVDLGKPAPQTDGKIRASLVSLLLPGLSMGVTYEARVSAIGPDGKSPVAVSPNTFQFACPSSLTASSYVFEPFGGSGSLYIQTPAVCPWAATSSVPWLTPKPGNASGFGGGLAVFTAAINDTKAPRSATLTVGGKLVTVTQPVATCAYTLTPVNLPASVSPVIDAAKASVFTWGDLSTDPRALQAVSYAGRRAAAWYSTSTVSIAVPAVNAGPQQLAVYVADFDAAGRAETIEILSPAGAVLDSRPVANFGAGQYLVWTVAGDVTVRATRTSGPNALVSGVFVGPTTATVASGAAAFVKVDTATSGDWMTLYGGNAYSIAGDVASRLYTSAGGFGAMAMAAPSICPWTVTADASWLTVVSSSTGTGDATIGFNLGANPTGGFRTAVLSSQGQNVPFVQAGAVAKPDAVDCVVSAWSDWGAWSPWTPVTATTEQRTHTRTRTVTTPASNGGAACPALTETEPETRTVTVDACATGAPQVFITGFTETTKKAGSQMLVNYQLASDFPIIRTVVKVDGVVVQDSGLGREVRLQVYGSMWFTAPAIGTHAVSVAVTNLSTCVREAASPVPLRIKQ